MEKQVCLDELLRAQAHVWNHIFNFINSMSLKCAVELNIAGAIQSHGGHMTLPELVSALPVNGAKAPHVRRLMRILVHAGLFDSRRVQSQDKEEEVYALNGASRLLVKDDPFSMAPFVLAMLDPFLMDPWQRLGAWLRQNEVPTAFAAENGKVMWEHAEVEPRLNRFFSDGMASDSRLEMRVVMERCREAFDGLGSIVDVGGGTGTAAQAIAEAFPAVECTVLDLPHVVVGCRGSKNLKYVGGDMLEDIPPGDAVLLKWILHDWGDEDCVRILKRCKEAITSENRMGKVIIIEMVMGKCRDSSERETELFFDMMMMTLLNGKERDEKEWAKLFFDAGFSNYKIAPVLGLRSLIEVYP